MFHVELAPLGGTYGPLKSDLGVFWPFRATDFIMGILKIWDNFLGPQLPILKFTFFGILAQFVTIWHQQKRWVFFTGSGPFRTHVRSCVKPGQPPPAHRPQQPAQAEGLQHIQLQEKILVHPFLEFQLGR